MVPREFTASCGFEASQAKVCHERAPITCAAMHVCLSPNREIICANNCIDDASS